MEFTNRRLMWHGMFLFLIGLLTGFAEQHFANERMGLAAHLEGVMNGTFLVALGAIWNEVRLSSLSRVIAYCCCDDNRDRDLCSLGSPNKSGELKSACGHLSGFADAPVNLPDLTRSVWR
jgi:hypothetical protein